MIGFLINLVSNANSMYQKKKIHDAEVEAAEYDMYVNKMLATEQLAVTYNSIMQKALEAGETFRRQQLDLAVEARQAEGRLATQAAAQGVTGRRADLARESAVNVTVREKGGRLRNDAVKATDALIHRAEMEAKVVVNRLITNQPDIPDGDGVDALGFITDAYDSFVDFKERSRAKEDAIVSGATSYTQNGPISSTGQNAYGVQAQL